MYDCLKWGQSGLENLYVTLTHEVYHALSKDEFGKDIIRLIIPDTNGKYPWDKDCKEDYKKQWTKEDEINAKNNGYI